MSDEARSEEYPRVIALLRRFGFNATSFQVLEPGFRYWFQGDHACVAYVDTGRAWVAAGAPIAAEQELEATADAFVEAARLAGRRVVLFATEQRFRAKRFDSLLIGQQPIWDPRSWNEVVQSAPRLREQFRRARAKGVAVQRLPPHAVDEGSPERREIERLIERWMGEKPMPPMGFLVRVHPFAFASERRLFTARASGKLVGFLSAVPVYERGGWFVEDLIRAPDAPNGTVDVLIDEAMRTAGAERSTYFTLGLAPLSGAVEFWLGAARRYGSALYDFSGLHAFKSKFKPRQWAPIYLSFPRGQSPVLAIYDSLVAFAQGGLLRFGVETLLRGPDVVVRVLTWLLVPWTAALALLAPGRWFPSLWVHAAWVVFDVALIGLLFALTRRFQPRLLTLALALVASDTVLTALQVVLFNAPRVHTAGELGVMLVAVAAPALASVVLYSARRRRVQRLT